ncbi:MAG: hypothetical protein KGL91_07175 [Xanthomonadaceae bacterium]|nr:hypothetical protein [Xanthomonadaceae bacterium]
MKVQLQGQALRLRLDEAELASLLVGRDIASLTRLLPGNAFDMQVRLSEEMEPALMGAHGQFRFHLPRSLLEPYVARLPCRDGLRFELPVGGDDVLVLEFEVDVRDSVRSRGPRKH